MTGKLLFGGDKLKIKATADEGQYVKSLTVDGTEIFTNDDTSVTETVQEVTVANMWPSVYVTPEQSFEVVPVFEVASTPTILDFSFPENYEYIDYQVAVSSSETIMHHRYYKSYCEALWKKIDTLYIGFPSSEVLVTNVPKSVNVEYSNDQESLLGIGYSFIPDKKYSYAKQTNTSTKTATYWFFRDPGVPSGTSNYNMTNFNLYYLNVLFYTDSSYFENRVPKGTETLNPLINQVLLTSSNNKNFQNKTLKESALNTIKSHDVVKCLLLYNG